MTRKILTAVLLLFVAAIVATPQVNTFCASNLACAISGTWTFSSQLVSSVVTGTPPFSIASTTVIPNLNAQLHGGLIAPASAIVGINDSQTLTNKSVDCTANTLSKNPCVVYSTVPAATTVGITATTMATAGGAGNTYRFGVYADQTVLGASCASNTTVTIQIIFTDPNSSSTTTSGTQTFTIVTNGTVGTNNLLNSTGNYWLILRAKASTTVQFATTVSGGASCSPAPTYQIYPILELIA